MIEVKDLLGKFERVLLSEESKRAALAQAVSETLQVTIGAEEVRIKGDTAYLNLKPIYKNEVFLKQDEIQKRLAELLLGRKPPSNIR